MKESMKEEIMAHTGRATGKRYTGNMQICLLDKGDAYYAFDTPEQLETLRSESEKAGNTFIYNASVREKLSNSISLPETEWKEKLEKGEPYVIRYKMPS